METVFKKAFIFILMVGVVFSAFTCLCSHEKPVQTTTSHACHEHAQEPQNSEPTQDCCCMDRQNVGEVNEIYTFSSVNTLVSHELVPVSLESAQPVIITFKLDRNFHPPTSKLPIYFSKHSFLI